MKKLYLIALLVTLSSSILSSCSNNDEPSSSNVIGKWICVESTNDYETYAFQPDQGRNGIVFFNGEFKSSDNLISGKKCFILNDGKAYIEDEGYKSNPTELDWNKNVYTYSDGEQEFDKIYILKGNSLTIVECDLDRLVGTISIDGNIMTYTYKYQNWNYDSQLMTSESETFISKFQKE